MVPNAAKLLKVIGYQNLVLGRQPPEIVANAKHYKRHTALPTPSRPLLAPQKPLRGHLRGEPMPTHRGCDEAPQIASQAYSRIEVKT